MSEQYYRQAVCQLLAMRKDIRYRKGLLHGFRTSNRISQDEWRHLSDQVSRRVANPTMKVREGDESNE
jgi:hypothetical protein